MGRTGRLGRCRACSRAYQRIHCPSLFLTVFALQSYFLPFSFDGSDVMSKQLLSAIAIGLTIAAYFPYIRSIIQGKTKPHVFSWVIWGTSTCIVFLAQLVDKGGACAWVIGFSGIISIYAAFLAFIKRSDSSITRID